MSRAKVYEFFAISYRHRYVDVKEVAGEYVEFYDDNYDYYNYSRYEWRILDRLYETHEDAERELLYLTDGDVHRHTARNGSEYIAFGKVEDDEWQERKVCPVTEFRILTIESMPAFSEPPGKGTPWFVGALHKKIPARERARKEAARILVDNFRRP